MRALALLLIPAIGLVSGCGAEPSSTPRALPAETSLGTTGDERKDKPVRTEPPGPAPKGMVWVPGGMFTMGDRRGQPDERAEHQVALDGFWMDRTEVTNAQFAEFTKATGYVTTAEKPPPERQEEGVLAGAETLPEFKGKPGSIVFRPPARGQLDPQLNAYNWWAYVPGADWRHPEGPKSSIDDRMQHPVVHVSWGDAVAYCRWAKKRLPTEAEWEYAARGGLSGAILPWGDEITPDRKWRNNIWQGEFPFENTKEDGYRTTAPVGSFPANGYGLHELSGNVWEWCADWYQPGYYMVSPQRNPEGPADSFDPAEPGIAKRVQRGGSFMCSDSYCTAYRVSARGKGEPSSGVYHTGFRCVRSAP